MNKVTLTFTERLAHSILPIILGIYLTLYPLSQPLLLENSQEFLNFSPLHGLAYPTFLKLVGLFSESLYLVVYVQIWLFVLALICLSVSIRKIGQNNGLGIATIIPIGLTPYVLEPLFSIDTKALFITATLLMMSFLFSALRKGGFRNLFGFGLAIGVCASIESYGLIFLLLILLATPLIAQNIYCSWYKALLIPTIAAIGLFAVEETVYSAVHGEDQTSAMGPKVFAKAALIDSLQNSPYAQKDERTRIWTMVEEKLALKRNEIWQQKSYDDRMALIKQNEYELAHHFARYELEQASEQLGKSIELVQRDIAVSRMVQDPWAYSKLGFDHMRRIWSLCETGNPVVIGFWLVTFLCIIVTAFQMMKGRYINPFFAAAFLSALAIHLHTLHLAFSGMGISAPLMTLSPLLLLCVLSIFYGVYLAFIHPQRTDV